MNPERPTRLARLAEYIRANQEEDLLPTYDLLWFLDNDEVQSDVDGANLGDRVVVNGGMGDYDTGTLVDVVAGMALVNIDKNEGGTYPQWVQATAVRKRS